MPLVVLAAALLLAPRASASRVGSGVQQNVVEGAEKVEDFLSRLRRTSNRTTGEAEPVSEEEEMEHDEEQAAVRKCNPAELSWSKRTASRTSLAQTLKQATHAVKDEPPRKLVKMSQAEVIAGLWHDNSSILQLVDRGEVTFDDYQCDRQEKKDFYSKFGLSGGCHSTDNFAFKTICASGNVVWFYPLDDANKAFCINTNVCHRMTEWSKHACSVQLYRVGTVQQALEILDRYPDSSIKHTVLGGHGDGMSLRWGARRDGRMGVAGRERPVASGSIVQSTASIKSMNDPATAQPIRSGMQGYVLRIDDDGDGIIKFDGLAAPQVVIWSDLKKFTSEPALGETFLKKLGGKMHRHGSIFVDSCKSARPDRRPNLAQFVANTVGHGIKVVGSEVSFGIVRVRRFHDFDAGIVKPEDEKSIASAEAKERIYRAKGARCPYTARWLRPNEEGLCRCPMGQECRTKKGNHCPTGDKKSTRWAYFQPWCAEEWVEDRCYCHAKHIFGELSGWFAKKLRSNKFKDD